MEHRPIQESVTCSETLLEQLRAHAKQVLPNECCGYISGHGNELKTYYKLKNLDNKPDHFTMDPKEQFQALKTARQQGEELLVMYHSHPETPARLSDEDKRLLKDPNMIYMIISCETEPYDIKAYRLVSDTVYPIKMNQKKSQATGGLHA